MKKYAGEEFLNRIYTDLATNPTVVKSGTGGNKNIDVATYLARIERVNKRYQERLDKSGSTELVKILHFDKFVIKLEDVPESYFDMQKQIALDRGYGHLEYTKELKRQEIESIIKEQQESLTSWMDYLSCKDTEHYPTWFKYYVYRSILKIGYYDKEKSEFTKRTKSTTKPFIEIDREALAMVYDYLVKALEHQEIDDKNLETLLKNGSFPKIYAYCIRKLDEAKKDITDSDEGIWKKYDQGSDPNILFNDIHGKGTGWCTAGGIETARDHLNDGDFYVYFTKDKEGEFTQPRIAIRMEDAQIAEVRGIAPNQNIEPNMEKVVKGKLKEFPDGKEYEKKVKDMEMLTYIYTKWKNDQKLTRDNLLFLYEINNQIQGFGYRKDPRIKEILITRNKKYDLSYVFGCKGENIVLTQQEWERSKVPVVYLDTELVLSNLKSAKSLVLPKVINGDLDLRGLTDVSDLDLSNITINGNLNLASLNNSDGLKLPQTIGGSLVLSNLTSAKGLVLPKVINGDLDLRGLISIDGLDFVGITVNDNLYLSCLKNAKNLDLSNTIIRKSLILDSLEKASSVKFPRVINYGLDLSNLTNAEDLDLSDSTIDGSLKLCSLEKLKGLKLPKVINGDLDLTGLKSCECLDLSNVMIEKSLLLNFLPDMKDLVLPKIINYDICFTGDIGTGNFRLSDVTINGNLEFKDLKNAGSLDLSNVIINGNLYFRKLVSGYGLNLSNTVINGSLYLDRLENAGDILFPKSIGGILDLSCLGNAEGLVLPQKIGNFLDLSHLKSAEGVVFPQYIGGNLDLSRLTHGKELVLPQYIGNVLNLCKLESAVGVVFPKEISGHVRLDSLRSAKGLNLSNVKIGGVIDLSNLIDEEGLVLPQRIDTLKLNNLISVKSLDLSNTIFEGSLYLNSLRSAEGLIFPREIGGNLFLNKLITSNKLRLPEYISGSLFLLSLISADGLDLSNVNVGEKIELTGLSSLEGLCIPEYLQNKIILSDRLDKYYKHKIQKRKKGDLGMDIIRSAINNIKGLFNNKRKK